MNISLVLQIRDCHNFNFMTKLNTFTELSKEDENKRIYCDTHLRFERQHRLIYF